MRNTWINSLETRSVEERMLDEDAKLLNYLEDVEKLERRIREIAQAVIDEFWRPEAFAPSDDIPPEFSAYCQHMMHWKGLIESAIPHQTTSRIQNTYKEGSLFKCVLMEVLEQLDFYNNFYTDLFFKPEGLKADDGTLLFNCKCPACS